MSEPEKRYVIPLRVMPVGCYQFREPWRHADGFAMVCSGVTCDCREQSNATNGRWHVHTPTGKVLLKDGDWIVPIREVTEYRHVESAEDFERKYKRAWFVFKSDSESSDEFRDRKLMEMPHLSGSELEVLRQCAKPCWDGDVSSKACRDELYSKGLIVRHNGWQLVTLEGLAILETLGYLREYERR